MSSSAPIINSIFTPARPLIRGGTQSEAQPADNDSVEATKLSNSHKRLPMVGLPPLMSLSCVQTFVLMGFA